jgi:hypothetical protein|tara:strand:+ start:4602 stop:4937 length:336 start_codon:yes stop_codon:yes gene_type:complete
MNSEQIREDYYKIGQVQNFRQIRVKYYPPTNHRNARIKIYEPSRFSGDEHHKNKMFVFLPSEMNATIQAWDYLHKQGFDIVGKANDQEETIFFCNNWGESFIEVNGETRKI